MLLRSLVYDAASTGAIQDQCTRLRPSPRPWHALRFCCGNTRGSLNPPSEVAPARLPLQSPVAGHGLGVGWVGLLAGITCGARAAPCDRALVRKARGHNSCDSQKRCGTDRDVFDHARVFAPKPQRMPQPVRRALWFHHQRQTPPTNLTPETPPDRHRTPASRWCCPTPAPQAPARASSQAPRPSRPSRTAQVRHQDPNLYPCPNTTHAP